MKWIILLLCFFQLQAQQPPKNVYKLSGIDAPILIGGTLLFGFGNSLFQYKRAFQETDIQNFNKKNVNSFERFSTHFWSPGISKASDAFVGLSFLTTPMLLTDKKVRKEWFTVGFMFLESALWTAGTFQTVKGSVDRARPYVYNTNAPLQEKLSKDARASFFSGHTALASTFSFFAYRVFSDYYPKSDLKPYFLATAAALPLITGTLRVLSGKHYLSDVLIGYLVGGAIGYTMPRFHKVINTETDKKVKFHPVLNGFIMTVKL